MNWSKCSSVGDVVCRNIYKNTYTYEKNQSVGKKRGTPTLLHYYTSYTLKEKDYGKYNQN